jgi:hypothetical protein
LHCINCGNKQSEGKFCAICGMTLGSQIIDVEKAKSRITIRTDTQTNEYVEKLKAVSKMYWNYFLTYLRRPSEVLKQGGKEFVNGIVNIVIMAMFVGLALFTLLKRTTWPPYTPSFFQTIGSTLAFVLICTAIVIGSLFLTIKFLGPDQSFENIAGIYGTHLIPSTFLVLIAFILLNLKAYTFGNLLLLFALLLAFFFVPIYILIKLLEQEATALDPLYCVIAYIVIFGIAFTVFLSVLGDTVMGGLMSRSNFFL